HPAKRQLLELNKICRLRRMGSPEPPTSGDSSIMRILPPSLCPRRTVLVLIAAMTLLGDASSAQRCAAEDTSLTESNPPMRVYVGAYTRQNGKGIYVFDFDPETGKAGKPSLAVEAANPSFVDIHPSGKFLYSVGEIAIEPKPEK